MRLALSLVMLTPLAAAQGEAAKPVEIGLNELFTLCRLELADKIDGSVQYRTIGLLRRTKELDAQGRFALVHPVASCCANGIAVGLCVRTEGVADFTNGSQVTIVGCLQPAVPAPHLPRGYMAQIRFGIVRQTFEIIPSRIEVYDRLKDTKLKDLADKLDSPSYATFAKALRATGWDKTLRQPSYFTLLAPTEHAFARLSEAERRALFAPENADQLAALVKRHIIAGWKSKSDLMAHDSVKTLGRVAVPTVVTNGRLRIGGARILFQDASARNGIVLTLDRLLPEPKK